LHNGVHNDIIRTSARNDIVDGGDDINTSDGDGEIPRNASSILIDDIDVAAAYISLNKYTEQMMALTERYIDSN
jgi:hypothetical protein